MGSDDRIQIRISDDELEVYASVSAGCALATHPLEAKLDALGICEGRIQTAIERVNRALERETASPNEVLIAEGIAPTAGQPEFLELDEPSGLLPGRLRDDGSLDYRDRRLVVPLSEGDRIGRRHPAIPGKPGRSIFGEEVAPPSLATVEDKLGEGARFEGDVLIATRSGARVVDAQGAVDVVDLYVHAGDVDTASGNLESRGCIEIGRDVANAMRVRATGDIRIGGTVDGGRVEAGGSVEIRGGAIGRESGIVRAEGDLHVRHALGIRLYAKGLLTVDRSVSTSRLHACQIEVAGQVLSESITAEELIRVQSAGSPSGSPCRLRVAIPLKPEDFDPSLRPATLGGPVPARSKSPLGRSGRKRASRRSRDSSRATATSLELRIAWRKRQKALLRHARIQIDGTAHAGCLIEIGTAKYVLERDVQQQTYRLDPETGKIVSRENQS